MKTGLNEGTLTVAGKPRDNGFSITLDTRYVRLDTPEKSEAIAIVDCPERANELARRWNCHDQLIEAARLGLRAMRSLGWDEAEKSGPSAQLRQWFDTAYAAWEIAEGGTR